MIKHGLIGELPLDLIPADAAGQTTSVTIDPIEPFDPQLPNGKSHSLVWQRDLPPEQISLNNAGLSAVRAVLRSKRGQGN